MAYWTDVETFALIVARRDTNEVNKNFFKKISIKFYILNYYKGLKFMRTCACAHPTDHVTLVKLHLYKV